MNGQRAKLDGQILPRIGHSAFQLAAASLFSPVAGAAVEMAVAWRCGSSALVDGFRIAYVIIAVGAGMLFVQILPHVLIPLFAECRTRDSESEAWRLAISVAAAISALTAAAAAAICLASGAAVRALGPGLTPEAAGHAEFLLRVFAITLPALAWCATINGVLQIYGRFLLLPISQGINNLALCVFILTAGPQISGNSFAYGVLAGTAIMTFLHAAYIVRVLAASALTWNSVLHWTRVTYLRKAVRIAFPLLLGVVIQQWTVMVLNRVLSTLGPGKVAQWGYSWKLLLIVAIAPTALATVLFPRLSQKAAAGDAASTTIDRSVRMSLFLIVPLLPALIIIRWPLVLLMFRHGAMDLLSARAIADLFMIALLQAPTFAFSVTLIKSAYARKDFTGPLVVCAITATAATLGFPAAAKMFGLRGLVIAAAGERWLNAAGLILVESRANRRFRPRTAVLYLARLLSISTAIAALSYFLWLPFKGHMAGTSPLNLILQLLTYAFTVGLLWLAVSGPLRIEEAESLKSLLFTRFATALLKSTSQRNVIASGG